MVFTLLQVWEGKSGSGQFSVPLVNPSYMDWTSNFTVGALPGCVSLEEVLRFPYAPKAPLRVTLMV